MALTFLWADSGKHLFGSDLLEGKKKNKKNPQIPPSIIPSCSSWPFGGSHLMGSGAVLAPSTLQVSQVVKERRKSVPSTQRDSATPGTTECCSISPALAQALPVISPAPALLSPTVREIGSQPISFPSLRGR